MPDNIAFLRIGFERVIFPRKGPLKALLRKYIDGSVGKSLHLVGEIPCWHLMGLKSAVVLHSASRRSWALIHLDSYTLFKQLQNEPVQKQFSLSTLGGLWCCIWVMSCWVSTRGRKTGCLGFSRICCRNNNKKILYTYSLTKFPLWAAP